MDGSRNVYHCRQETEERGLVLGSAAGTSAHLPTVLTPPLRLSDDTTTFALLSVHPPLCQWSAGCLCPRVPTLAAITISEPPSPGSRTWHSDHIALSIYTGQTFEYPNWKQKHCVSTKHTATTSTAILKEFDKPAGFQRDNDYYHHDPHNHVSRYSPVGQCRL